jgi:hypothetical protein
MFILNVKNKKNENENKNKNKNENKIQKCVNKKIKI